MFDRKRLFLGCCLASSFLVHVTVASDGGDEGGVVNLGQEVTVDVQDAVLDLNRFTFGGNVLEDGGLLVSHWVVLFCPSWWAPCQQLAPQFSELAGHWQGRLNAELLTSEVRFAKVDCATDKVLCNQQDVQGYPTVFHYRRGERVARFFRGRSNDGEELAKWLRKQLGGLTPGTPEPRAGFSLREAIAQQLALGDHAADLLVMAAALALTCRTVTSNPELWQKGPAMPSSRDSTGEPAAGVARYLPGDWLRARAALEL